MKLSTCINSIAKVTGDEEAIRLVAEAGFDAWDFSMFGMAPCNYQTRALMPSDHPLAGDGWREYATHLGEVGRAAGVICNQSHAPFPSYVPGILPYLERAIEATALAGGRICVIHPMNTFGIVENVALYRSLLPTAHRCGVAIATENMWNWDYKKDEAMTDACSHHDEFLAYMEAVNDPAFVACVDIGHAEMRGLDTDAYTMLKTLGHHVAAIHLHDNDRHHDSHELPFTMQIDFDRVARALAEIDYRGEITLEACYYQKDATKEEQPARLASMVAAARRFAALLEQYR